MKTEDKYQGIVEELNQIIHSFNAFLSPSFSLKNVSCSDASTFADFANVPWESQHWPSKDDAGVYIFCGSLPGADRVVAYVGKASQGNIGTRLSSYLNWQRKYNEFVVENYNNEKFPIEALFCIPIPRELPRGFASALQEHIISVGISGIELVNAIGNKAGNR